MFKVGDILTDNTQQHPNLSGWMRGAMFIVVGYRLGTCVLEIIRNGEEPSSVRRVGCVFDMGRPDFYRLASPRTPHNNVE